MCTEEIKVRCCIVGGGPAGMMLGFLLARAGIDVAVLEKHGDFLRDFRGDSVHPSTLEIMFELGILDEFFASATPESGTHCCAKPLKVPSILKLMQRWPILQRIPARAIGLGARREHVKTAEVHRPQKSAVA